MIVRITRAIAIISHIWTCRGSTPCGTTRRSRIVPRTSGASALGGRSSVGTVMASSRLAGDLELESLFAERQIAAFKHLRHDVHTPFHLEVHEVWRFGTKTFFDELVQGGKGRRVGVDIGEAPVGEDGSHVERALMGLETIRELQFRWERRPELV